MRSISFFQNLMHRLSSIFWPEVCPFCLAPCRDGICPSCRRKLEKLAVRDPVCLCCGRPISDEQQEFCRDCQSQRVFTQGASLWLHRDPVSFSLYQFKYHDQRAFAGIYARELAARYGRLIRSWKAQCLIPVPLHPRRQRQRGYNQAELLARELGKLLDLPVAAKAVERVKYTQPQKALGGFSGRRRNLKQAFLAQPPVRPVKRVIVVDDIYTTGSTIEEVGRALKEVGVGEVYFLTVSTSPAVD